MNALNTDARKVVVTVKFIAFILPGVVLHFSHCHNISQRYNISQRCLFLVQCIYISFFHPW
jgi:hypothetical protein